MSNMHINGIGIGGKMRKDLLEQVEYRQWDVIARFIRYSYTLSVTCNRLLTDLVIESIDGCSSNTEIEGSWYDAE